MQYIDIERLECDGKKKWVEKKAISAEVSSTMLCLYHILKKSADFYVENDADAHWKT